MLEMGTRRSPKISWTTLVSALSLCFVPVPWALMKSTCSGGGVMPERAMAERMAVTLPAASG